MASLLLWGLVGAVPATAQIWDGAEGDADGWKQVAWFGWINSQGYGPGWVNHEHHGFIYATGTDDSLYFYQEGLGWFWTTKEVYPELFSFGLRSWTSWLYDGARFFYHYRSGEWRSEATFYTTPADISDEIALLLRSHDVPALAGIVVKGGEVVALGASGDRRRTMQSPVTLNDQWHVGSLTKSMTSVLAARLVYSGLVTWERTLAETFPALSFNMQGSWKQVTLPMLLSHISGAPANVGWWSYHNQPGSTVQDRRQIVADITSQLPVNRPGTAYLYSNTGYAMAGSMMEEITDTSWETLIDEELFTPLGMDDAGQGTPASEGQVDHPWGHTAAGDEVEPGPGGDNAPPLGPAGRVHVSLHDMGKYLLAHLNGNLGYDSSFLPLSSWQTLHSQVGPTFFNYAFGLGQWQRDWANGLVFYHNGTNTMFFAEIWIAPLADFAVFVVTNQGGDVASAATDALAGWSVENILLD